MKGRDAVARESREFTPNAQRLLIDDSHAAWCETMNTRTFPELSLKFAFIGVIGGSPV
jgi:hypothetical protein